MPLADGTAKVRSGSSSTTLAGQPGQSSTLYRLEQDRIGRASCKPLQGHFCFPEVDLGVVSGLLRAAD